MEIVYICPKTETKKTLDFDLCNKEIKFGWTLFNNNMTGAIQGMIDGWCFMYIDCDCGLRHKVVLGTGSTGVK